MSRSDRLPLISRAFYRAVRVRRNLAKARRRAGIFMVALAIGLSTVQAWPSSGGGHSATPHSHTHKKGGSQSSKTPTW